MRGRDFQLVEMLPRGGINLLTKRRQSLDAIPRDWGDLFNVIPRPSGIASGPGWAIKNAEIATANGIVNAIAAFPRTDDTYDTVVVTAVKTYEDSASAWAAIQDGNNYSMGSLDHADVTWWNDNFYIGIPVSGTANALRKWTGTGNIAALGGSPKNAGGIESLANRIFTARRWSGTTFKGTEVERSATGTDNSWPGNVTDIIDSPSTVMAIKRLGQTLVIYKQYAVSILEPTGDDRNPVEVGEYPASGLGLALPFALGGGSTHHMFMSGNDIYLFDGMNNVQPIGGPILPAFYNKFAAGSFCLIGYDERQGEFESYWMVTNVALAANDVALNSAASTNTYWIYDKTTQAWARGDVGANAPRAIGNIYNRYGILDAAPLPQYVQMIALDSSGGSSVYEVDYTVANRIGATFTRRGLVRPFHFGDPFRYKTVADIRPLTARNATGTVTISWKTANQIGAVPSEVASVSFNLSGHSVARINVTGIIHQWEVTATGAFAGFEGLACRMRVRS